MIIERDAGPRKIISALYYAPFDEAKEAIERDGHEIISLEQSAKLRLQEGLNHSVFYNEHYVSAGVVYVPENERAFLTKRSPIMANAREATKCHSQDEEFFLTPIQLEEALSDSIEIIGEDIPTDDFESHIVTRFAFGDSARGYGQLLNLSGVKEMYVTLLRDWQIRKDHPFVRQIILDTLRRKSGLNGVSRDLYMGDRGVRGALENRT